MRSKILFISLVFINFWALAQSVDVTIEESRLDSLNKYLFMPVAESVDAWEEINSPNLFAYPVDVNIDLSEKATSLAFERAAETMLLIEYSEAAAGGLIVARTAHGKTLWKKGLQPGKSRLLLDVSTSETVLSYVNSGSAPDEAVHITRVYIKPAQEYAQRDLGFGESDICHPNAPCTENDPWRDQVRSSARIRMALEEGIGWCSGTLMNNSARDGTPYILSAEHCLALNTPMWDLWRFDFNYVSPTCDNPASEPVANSLTGCALKSKSRDTDFMLLELNQFVPVAFHPYFSGWNRTVDYNPAKVALIHHPSADITKVSRDLNPTTVWDKTLEWLEGYSTPPNTHLRSRFDDGAFEPGSSGAALYDQDGYVVGQLHGGTGNCISNTAFSGMFAAAWDYGDRNARLHDYLDPVGDTSMILEGMEHPDIGNVYSMQCTITDPYGEPVRNVELSLSGAVEMTVFADSMGVVTLDLLPRFDTVTFKARKNINPTNGVSALDLLLIKQHLLGINIFTEPHKILAADATANNTLSASDILFLQKLLLGILQYLPSQESWIFSPSEITIANPAEADTTIQFMAIKIGDVNGTADPNK